MDIYIGTAAQLIDHSPAAVLVEERARVAQTLTLSIVNRSTQVSPSLLWRVSTLLCAS